jgi:hypothetical protein
MQNSRVCITGSKIRTSTKPRAGEQSRYQGGGMHDTYIHLSTMQKSRVCTTGSAIHTSTSTRAEEQSMYHGLRDQYTHHNTYRGAGKYHMLREQYTNHSTCKQEEYLSRVPRSMHTHQYIQKSRVCIPRLNMLSIFRKLLGSCQNCGVLCSNFSMGHHHHNKPFRHHPFVVILGTPPPGAQLTHACIARVACISRHACSRITR